MSEKISEDSISMDNEIKSKESIENEIKEEGSMANKIKAEESMGKEIKIEEPMNNEMKTEEPMDNEMKTEEPMGNKMKTEESMDSEVKTEKSIDNKIEMETNGDEANESDKHDPYSYTRLKDFTSEIYKIEINNIPPHIGYGQLKKLLNGTLKLKTHKVKVIGLGTASQFVFTTFRNEEDRDRALKLINGHVWKGRTLTAKRANPAADPLVQKRKAGDSEDCPSAKKCKEDDIPIEKKIKYVVTPYWDIPYEEQLKRKENDIRKFLIRLGRAIEKVNRNLAGRIKQNRKEHKSQCCPLSAIKPSPTTTGYRNKCEFTAGRHLHTKEKTVGFRLNSYKAGSMSVAEPDDCINISSVMLKAVKSFQDYIRASDKDVYNPENHEGYWRQLTVRTSNNDDVLLIVVMHPQSLTEEELKEEERRLKEYYEAGPGSNCGITSVYFQLFSKKGCSDESLNLTHLMGKKVLEETVLGMKFQINPEAFFQINVPATEVLYSMVRDYVQATSESSVVDVCCGTGTISLCLAKAGAKVVGVELCREAVENAKLNAENNGISNVEFICGKAEEFTAQAINKCGGSDIIAVVDPPRAGLHQKVLKAIRATQNIKKLIYVSCNPDSAFANFIDLCRPTSNNFLFKPFYPTEAAVVDMFPHTPHKELILVFERCK